MSIYDMKRKDIANMLIKFSRTEYGKTQFLLSYSIPFIAFFIMIILFVMLLLVGSVYKKIVMTYLFISTIICLFSFVFGSIHYYNELRLFSLDNQKKSLRLWKKF